MSNHTKLNTTICLFLNGESRHYASRTEAIQSILFEYIELKTNGKDATLLVQAANQSGVKDMASVIEKAIASGLSEIYTAPKSNWLEELGVIDFFKAFFGGDDIIQQELPKQEIHKQSATTASASKVDSV
jgi:hypothetical protein